MYFPVRTILMSLTLALTAHVIAHAAEPSDPHVILAEANRIVSDGGVDEAKAVEIGGIQQWITVRGKNRDAPILLLIHGGPAAPDLPNRYLFETPWTDYFVVVEWDQRGSGKTYALNDPAAMAPTMTKERMVEDAEELVAYLRATYHRPKIFVMAHSWGTILGMELAKRKPEELYAYVGVGQMINTRAAERIAWDKVLDTARRRHDADAVRELEAIEPYPNLDGSIPIEKIGTERKWSVRYGYLTHNRDTYDVWENAEKISPDYSEADFKAIDQGSGFSLPKLLPDMTNIDFDGVTKLDCPVIIFAGRYDYTTPSDLAGRWMDRVRAPYKRLIWFENSAHMMFEEEPGRVLVHLVQDVLPLASTPP